MEIVLSVIIGIGLSAACGLRIFVPLLIMSIAARTGHLTLAGSFEWIDSTPALIAFAVATVLEIGAYYLPVVDNVLDTVAGPVAVVAGILVTASQVVDFDPLLGWTLAVIAGGGAAAAVQGLTTVTRGASTMATAGFGNPLVSTAEAGGSVVTAVLAITLPLVAVVLVLVLIFFAVKKIFFTARRSAAAA